jgi:hypothetical protein
MNKAAKKCFKTLIHAFSLAIGLWVIRRAHFQCSPSQLENFLPKPTSKYPVTIWHNGEWKAMELVNGVHKKLGDLQC